MSASNRRESESPKEGFRLPLLAAVSPSLSSRWVPAATALAKRELCSLASDFTGMYQGQLLLSCCDKMWPECGISSVAKEEEREGVWEPGLLTSDDFYSPVPLQKAPCGLWTDCGAQAELRNCDEHPTSSAEVTPKVAVARCWLPPSNLNLGNSSGRIALPLQPRWGCRGLPGWIKGLSAVIHWNLLGRYCRSWDCSSSSRSL